MGHKVNPKSLRLGVNTNWISRWYTSPKDFAKNLQQDIELREFIKKTWKSAAIAEVEIERSKNFIRVVIMTSRPGILIGRGGSGIEDMTAKIKSTFFRGSRAVVKIDVREIRHYEENASLLAQNVAEQLERRIPFRKVLKSSLDQAQKNRNIKGVKILVSGRLGGAEMSRTEWLSRGTIPLHTIRANIDFARAIAYTTYGTIGVKVWIYKTDERVINNK